MIYQFRILSDEIEDFLLDIETKFDMNLDQFNAYLVKELGYNPAVISSIFTSDAEWEKLQEYTSEDMNIEGGDLEYALCDDCDAPIVMSCAKLNDVVIDKFDRLIFVFDPIAERQLYIELIRSLAPQSGVEYPRVVDRSGSAPEQELPFELGDL